MAKILVIGAAFVDVLVHVPKLPQTGEDITGILQGYRVGGSAFNVTAPSSTLRQAPTSLCPLVRDSTLTRFDRRCANPAFNSCFQSPTR